MKFDEVIQLHVLKRKSEAVVRGRALDDLLFEGSDVPGLRQMCAKVPAVLYDELENVCGLLDMSKREFIERAVSDALTRSHQIINDSGIFEAFSPKEG